MYQAEKVDQIRAKPAIHSVIDVSSGKADCCTPGGRFILRGRGFGEVEEPDLDAGVFVHGSGTVLHRIMRYEGWEDREIRGFWPESVCGPVWLFVETTVPNATVQSTVHKAPILPVSDR
jgi:hypothetical protein